MTEQKHDPIRDVIDRIRESDAYERVTDVTVPITKHVSDAVDNVRGAVMRLSNDGYDNLDLWNLGSSEVEHVSKVIKHLAGIYERQGVISERQAETMRHHATVLSKRDDVMETIGNAVLLHPFSKSRTVRGNRIHFEKVLRASESEVDREFLRSWDWFGRHFLTDAYVVPKTDAHDVLGFIDRASGGVAWIDYSEYPSYELRRLSSMLREFLHGNIGYPDGYRKSGRCVIDHDAKWEKDTALWAMFVDDDIREKPHKHETKDGNVVYSSATNEDYGVDFAAWSDDISYVANVFDQWREMLDCSDYPTGASFRVIRDTMRGEFLRCWHWMGVNIDSIWW